MSGFLIALPTPPSCNSLYANSKRGGRHKTLEYRKWIKNAAWEIKLQKPISILGKYKFFLTLPKTPKNSDLNNRLKAAQDIIVSLKLVQDDSSQYCVGSTVAIDEDLPGYATIAVESVEADTFASLGEAAARVLHAIAKDIPSPIQKRER
jgi:Holliday junction resolvase RusA-like endonuclease